MVTGCLMWPQCHVDTDEAVYTRLLMEMWITWYISDAMLSPMSSMTTSISMATWTTSWFHVSWMASFLKIAIHPYKELAKIGGTIHAWENEKFEKRKPVSFYQHFLISFSYACIHLPILLLPIDPLIKVWPLHNFPMYGMYIHTWSLGLHYLDQTSDLMDVPSLLLAELCKSMG